jgi:hypothetical protein
MFVELLRVSERKDTSGRRPGGPKEFSPGRQPWVQKALLFAGAPAGRKKRFRRGNSAWFCRPFRGLTGAWAWFLICSRRAGGSHHKPMHLLRTAGMDQAAQSAWVAMH